jgi:hypothetical protein
MRIWVEQAELLPDLVETLAARIDTVVSPVTEHDVEVSLLGSLRQPYLRDELERRLQRWRIRHPLAHAEIIDE